LVVGISRWLGKVKQVSRRGEKTKTLEEKGHVTLPSDFNGMENEQQKEAKSGGFVKTVLYAGGMKLFS